MHCRRNSVTASTTLTHREPMLLKRAGHFSKSQTATVLFWVEWNKNKGSLREMKWLKGICQLIPRTKHQTISQNSRNCRKVCRRFIWHLEGEQRLYEFYWRSAASRTCFDDCHVGQKKTFNTTRFSLPSAENEKILCQIIFLLHAFLVAILEIIKLFSMESSFYQQAHR